MRRDPGESPHPRDAAGARFARALPYLVLFGLVLVVYGRTLALGFLGHDSYPLVETSRITSFEEALGTFTESFMDGHFHLDYYRPILNLSFALDYALSGIEPFGYQVSHLAIFFGACAALYALARRCLGPRGGTGALLGTILFLVYPGHWEVIPVVCRRQDALSGMFIALCLLFALGPPTDERRGRSRSALASALFAFLAVGTKETGVLAVPLAWCASWLFLAPAGASFVARTLAAFRGAAPAALGLALGTAFRWLAIGGIGGESTGSVLDLDGALYFLRKTLLFDPDLFFANGPVWNTGTLWLVLLALSFALVHAVGAFVLRRPAAPRDARAEQSREPHRPHALRTLALGLLWIAGTTAVMAHVGKERIAAWHVFLPMLGVGLVFASAGSVLVELVRRGGASTKLAALAAAAPAACLLSLQLPFAAPLERPRQWAFASALGTEFLARLESQIEAAAVGDTLRIKDVPVRGPRKARDLGIKRPSVLAGHSVAAWAKLRFPDRKVLVVGPDGWQSRIPDGVVVALDVDVLDHSGAQGALREMLGEIQTELGLDGKQDALGLEKSRREGGYGAQKKQLLDIVLRSREQRLERLLVLIEYFDSIGDGVSATMASMAAGREYPDDPRAAAWTARAKSSL